MIFEDNSVPLIKHSLVFLLFIIPSRYPIANKNELNMTVGGIEISEGDLLIFPAYLPHSVGMNLSDEDRIVISFNVDILK